VTGGDREEKSRRERRKGGNDVIREGKGERKGEGRGGIDGWMDVGRLKYQTSNI
jgi:hypothetical protein